MEGIMTKTLLAFATAATLAAGTLAVPSTADAHCFGCAVGAGIVAGALLGTAVAASSGPYYGGGYYAPAYGAPCYWQTQRFWNGFNWDYRRVRVCY
jgi:hypothetical protein